MLDSLLLRALPIANPDQRVILTDPDSHGGCLGSQTVASVGLYGIMAYTVARRSREIAIRMALGAEPGNIGRQVLAETLALVCIGISIGLPIALLVRGLVFGLGFADPVAARMAAILLVAIATLAVVPAHRASRVDPILALRYE